MNFGFYQQNQHMSLTQQLKIHHIGGRQLVQLGMIGEGSYGKIFEVQDANSKEKFVLKVQQSMTEDEQNFTKEMAKRRFKNLVNVIEYHFDDRYHYILMEKCEGDMFNLYVEKKRLSDESFRHIASEIAKGIKELHDIGLVHRDIKPENIMIYKQIDKQIFCSQEIYKLGDFGQIKGHQRAQTMYQGTPYYLSPEQIGFQNQIYSFPVDIWAFGTVLYELCSQQILFQGQTQEEIYQKIKEQPIEPYINNLNLNQDYKSLILSMLNRNPELRPTINQIIKKLEIKIRAFKSVNVPRTGVVTIQKQKPQNLKIVQPGQVHQQNNGQKIPIKVHQNGLGQNPSQKTYYQQNTNNQSKLVPSHSKQTYYQPNCNIDQKEQGENQRKSEIDQVMMQVQHMVPPMNGIKIAFKSGDQGKTQIKNPIKVVQQEPKQKEQNTEQTQSEEKNQQSQQLALFEKFKKQDSPVKLNNVHQGSGVNPIEIQKPQIQPTSIQSHARSLAPNFRRIQAIQNR